MPWSYIISDYWHNCFDELAFGWSGFMSALPVLLDGLLCLLPPLSAVLAAAAFVQRIRRGESRLTLPAALGLALAVTQEIAVALQRSYGDPVGAGVVFFALLTLAPLVLLAISPLRALLKERRRLLDCVGIAAATLNIALLRNASIGWPASRFGGYPRYWIRDMLEELSPVGFDFAAWLGQFGAVLVYLLPLAGSVILLLRLARSLRGKRGRADVAPRAAGGRRLLCPAHPGLSGLGGQRRLLRHDGRRPAGARRLRGQLFPHPLLHAGQAAGGAFLRGPRRGTAGAGAGGTGCRTSILHTSPAAFPGCRWFGTFPW